MIDTDPGRDGLRLTEWTTCGGCAAKWGGAPLSGLLRELAGSADAALLVGLAPFDDAAVYRISDDLAVVSTTDFFPPLVDDPADFGAIAAANACSDVFAMGGRVTTALNIAAFPERLPVEAIEAILRAAAETVAAAGGSVVGGHTIRSEEPIFGLAVQGLVHPDRVLTKGGARPGDVLVLSKPLGTGIVLAGGSEGEKAAAIAGMRRLNRAASEALQELGPRRPRRHRRDRLRPGRARLGDGRPQRRARRARDRRAAPVRRGARRGRAGGPDRRRRAQPRVPRPAGGEHGSPGARRAVLRPADLRRPARRRRTRDRAGRPTAAGFRVVGQVEGGLAAVAIT